MTFIESLSIVIYRFAKTFLKETILMGEVKVVVSKIRSLEKKVFL